MDKVLITANSHFTLWNFRKRLIESFLNNNQVYIAVPENSKDCRYRIDRDITLCNIALNPRSKSILSNIFTLLSCLYQLVKVRPKTVLSFTIKNNIYFGILCRFLNISFIPNITGIGSYQKDCNKFQLLLINFLYKVSLKRAKHVFFQNSNDLNVLTAANIVNANKCSVIPGSGIDLNDFKFCEKEHKKNEPFIFIFASRLLIEKGIKDFLSAAAEISSSKKNHREVKFIICGIHEELDRRYISKELLSNFLDCENINYIGNVNNIKNIIKKSSCVVLPTYYKEGVPRILIESLAIGRPIITTKSPGCSETVIEGKTGYFVEPQNPNDLRQKMEIMINLEEDTYAQMTYLSRTRAEENFSDDIIKNNYHNILYNKNND